MYSTTDKPSANQPVIGRFGAYKAFASAEQERQVQQALQPFLSDTDGDGPKGLFANVLVPINDLDLIAISRSGLASKEMNALAERLDVFGKEMARLLTLSPRTYHHRRPEECSIWWLQNDYYSLGWPITAMMCLRTSTNSINGYANHFAS